MFSGLAQLVEHSPEERRNSVRFRDNLPYYAPEVHIAEQTLGKGKETSASLVWGTSYGGYSVMAALQSPKL